MARTPIFYSIAWNAIPDPRYVRLILRAAMTAAKYGFALFYLHRRHLIRLNYFKLIPLFLWINALLLDLNSLMNGTDE